MGKNTLISKLFISMEITLGNFVPFSSFGSMTFTVFSFLKRGADNLACFLCDAMQAVAALNENEVACFTQDQGVFERFEIFKQGLEFDGFGEQAVCQTHEQLEQVKIDFEARIAPSVFEHDCFWQAFNDIPL